MSEASFEMVLNELREAAPPAPERLRGLVRSLPAATPRFSLRIRPAISAAIVTMLVVGIGLSIYAGLRGDPAGHVNRANYLQWGGSERLEGDDGPLPGAEPGLRGANSRPGSPRSLDYRNRTSR